MRRDRSILRLSRPCFMVNLVLANVLVALLCTQGSRAQRPSQPSQSAQPSQPIAPFQPDTHSEGKQQPGGQEEIGTQSTTDAASQRPQAEPGLTLGISPGDLLTVDVFNTPELSGKFRVQQNGTISLPQGGVVAVGGMSPIATQNAIEARLRDSQIMLDPHVTIFVQEYASEGVIVLGEVKNPGTYTLLGEHSLYGALAAAGGATVNEGLSITITRPGDPLREEVIPVTSPNYSTIQHTTRVNPGDTVFVSRAKSFFVVGNVVRPGAYPLPSGEPIRVLEAIALASGTERAAAMSKASIIRQTTTGPETIPVNLKKIARNQDPDVFLQASDILVIPGSPVQAILDTAIPLATSATLSAIISASIAR